MITRPFQVQHFVLVGGLLLCASGALSVERTPGLFLQCLTLVACLRAVRLQCCPRGSGFALVLIDCSVAFWLVIITCVPALRLLQASVLRLGACEDFSAYDWQDRVLPPGL